MKTSPNRILPLKKLTIGLLGIFLFLLGISVLIYVKLSPIQYLSYRGSATDSRRNLILPLHPPTSYPYRAEIEVTGPDTLRFGTSAKIVLHIKVVTNTLPVAEPAIPLPTSGIYSTTVRIQRGNFDIDEELTGIREMEPLSLWSPVSWPWVISPREKCLGSQVLIFDVFIYDEHGQRMISPETGATYSTAEIYVTDPTGIPPWLVYSVTFGGGIMQVPLWIWILNEWSMRQKANRERKYKVAIKR